MKFGLDMAFNYLYVTFILAVLRTFSGASAAFDKRKTLQSCGVFYKKRYRCWSYLLDLFGGSLGRQRRNGRSVLQNNERIFSRSTGK